MRCFGFGVLERNGETEASMDLGPRSDDSANECERARSIAVCNVENVPPATMNVELSAKLLGRIGQHEAVYMNSLSTPECWRTTVAAPQGSGGLHLSPGLRRCLAEADAIESKAIGAASELGAKDPGLESFRRRK